MYLPGVGTKAFKHFGNIAWHGYRDAVIVKCYRDAVIINHWCEYSCIMNWLKGHPTYSLYAKNIQPGLSAENQLKQVAFSRRVMQRWGLLEKTKILWIHLDEKWFHGIVPRTNAKACPELGIEKTSFSAHHKKHIAKVMGLLCGLPFRRRCGVWWRRILDIL